ncbi:hypothetical protein MLD38_037954 [Melastoma candidum]|uniref:Uncharacterized protein n=1 Tax=Melastoma candidum TaxID=119954 RepID=A0ACB9KXN5_9MYRT|nr:hypothetical protein MLD38_037954 [Melastoma candidum]
MKVVGGADGDTGAERYSRDLLQRFSLCSGGSGVVQKLGYKSPSQETEELELSLGLSLGGKFGIEKSSKLLVRSASVAGALPIMREEGPGLIAGLSGSFPSIIRTNSLPTETEEEFRKRKPTETEEEFRKRKEWQSLQRLEAKRRRYKKQRKGGDEVEVQWTRNLVDMQKGFGNGTVHVLPLPICVPGPAKIAGQGMVGGGEVGDVGSKGKEGILGVGGYGLVGYGVVTSAVEARRGSSSGSSGGSDTDGRPTQAGSSTSNETKSLASNGPSSEMAFPAMKPSTGNLKEGVRDTFPRRDAQENKPKVHGMSLTEDKMPCVFTKGDGPDGIKVDGILYKYGKGEEVRIMCVCHGKFLSPAEFVKHAGGGDVANPHRRIFINTSTLVLK